MPYNDLNGSSSQIAKKNLYNVFTTHQAIGSTSLANLHLDFIDPKKHVWAGTANSSGNFYLWDATHNKWILVNDPNGVNTFNGNITGYSPNFCVYTASGDKTKSLANDTWTNIAEIAVVPGGWYLITAHVQFAANKNGARALNVRTSSAAANVDSKVQPSQSGVTEMAYFTIHADSATKIYLNAWQNSGGALNVTSASLSTLRLK